MLKDWLKNEISSKYPDTEFDILTPSDDKMGDYSVNLAFVLAKKENKNPREVAQKIVLEENRFGFDPEFTVKAAKNNFRIYEVGVSYAGRSYGDGKKIGWKDGLVAIWAIIKYALS